MGARLDGKGSRADDRSRDAAYLLVVRGPDGRPRSERFADAASYQARLATLERFDEAGVSVDDILALLDV